MNRRVEYLDFLKGAAIISVILLHAAPSRDLLFTTLAPFHIWQAVPVFLLVAGITTSISMENAGSFRRYYYKLPLNILFLASWYLIFLFVYVLMTGNGLRLSDILLGLLGSGGYFTPLIIQHIIFFPLFIQLKKKIGNDGCFLCIMFAVSAILEFLVEFINVGLGLYSMLWIRYIFASSLGAVIYTGINEKQKINIYLVLLSLTYIFLTAYLNVSIPYLNKPWIQQHYPAYFYTAFICVLLKNNYSKIPMHSFICFIGSSSYFIYLTQLVYFNTLWVKWHNHGVFRALFAVPICVLVGLACDHARKFYDQYKKKALSS